jgi:uncharacterized protein DUF3883
VADGDATVSLAALTSPTAVRAAIAECDSLGRELFLHQYGFKSATDYRVRYLGGEYDSKAIAGVAYGYQHGISPLEWNEFGGGKNSGCAGWALDRLGFEVTGIKHVGWWLDEVEQAIRVYFDMFARYKAGEKFTKAGFLKKLHDENPARSYKSYEYKLQNISAVLNDLGRDWLSGYAPKARYQKLLRFAVEDWLGRGPGTASVSLPLTKRRHSPRLVKIDWAKRDAENRALGEGGERYVFQQERQSLVEKQRPDLAALVKWDASEADGHGYDISSFDPDGTPIFIEVKTTTRGKDTAFFVSHNEVKVSGIHGERYRLYRVFNFLTRPDVLVHKGNLDDCFSLSPVSFRATAK